MVKQVFTLCIYLTLLRVLQILNNTTKTNTTSKFVSNNCRWEVYLQDDKSVVGAAGFNPGWTCKPLCPD